MKKKVLFVVHHMTIGGVQKSLISALHAMDYNKYDVTVYLQNNRTTLVPYIDRRTTIIINNDKTHYYRLFYSIILQLIIILSHLFKLKDAEKRFTKKLNNYITDRMMSNEAERYFKGKHFDVAVAYAACSEAPFVSNHINAKRKIVCFQGSTIDIPDMQPIILPKFDAVVVEDKSIENMLTENIPALSGKIRIIENYVDTDFLKEQAQEDIIDTPSDKTVLCSVGRQAYIKGFDLAAEAAVILKKKGLDFLWYFVGDGPENQNIKDIIVNNGLQNEVILTGMQTNPYRYINVCDIFVQPSREEAMSIAALESKVLCKPLVTTKTVGGMNICVDGETGVMTEISPEGIAQGIMRLIDNPDLCRKITENLEKTDFVSEKVRYGKQWEEVLEAI